MHSAGERILRILTKSKLLSPAIGRGPLPRAGIKDPVAIAKRLARQRLITRWQAGQLLAGRSSFIWANIA